MNSTKELNITSEVTDLMNSHFMLATLTATTFTGNKTDKSATDTLLASKGARSGSAKVVKQLFAGASGELDKVKSCIATARSQFYSMTLPWSEDRKGARLLANERFFEFIKVMKGCITDVDSALNELGAVYDQRRTEAMANLGGLANADEYPDWDEVRRRFKVSFNYNPVPAVSDYSRMNLPPAAIDKLVARSAEVQKELVKQAVADAWKRTVEPLQRIVNNLEPRPDGKAPRIYETLLGNLRIVVDNLKYFNLTNDPDMERVRKDILSQLCTFTTEDLKKSDGARAQAHQRAQSMLDRIEKIGFFGDDAEAA